MWWTMLQNFSLGSILKTQFSPLGGYLVHIVHIQYFLTRKSISEVNERENKWIKDKSDSGKVAKNTFFIALPISLFFRLRHSHNVVNFLFWCLSWCRNAKYFFNAFFHSLAILKRGGWVPVVVGGYYQLFFIFIRLLFRIE